MRPTRRRRANSPRWPDAPSLTTGTALAHPHGSHKPECRRAVAAHGPQPCRDGWPPAPTGPSFGRVVRGAIPSDGPANRPRVAARAMPSPFEPAITITEARGPWSVTRISVISDQLLVTSRRFRNVRIELPVVWIGPSWPTFGRDATRVVQSSSTRQIRSVWQVVGVSGALGSSKPSRRPLYPTGPARLPSLVFVFVGVPKRGVSADCPTGNATTTCPDTLALGPSDVSLASSY